MPYGIRSEQCVAAQIADFGRYMVDNDQFAVDPNGMRNKIWFILSRTTLN